MIVMALDHTREFFHIGAMSFQPEDLSRTTPALFFTRWITHICAPAFIFTAGLAASLWLREGRTKIQLSSFLWKRGVWLVVLELTAVRFAMYFSFESGLVSLLVFWAIGLSMIALGFLIHVPVRVLAVGSVLMVALHNVADPVSASQFGGGAWIWHILHQPGILRVDEASVLVAYPLVPWAAVMALGFCCGPIMRLEPARRRQWMIRTGLGLIGAFLLLRGLNVYGDPVPWAAQPAGLTMTILSFVRCAKYPPSLDFLLMTLGPTILLLAWLERVGFAAAHPLIVFGRVPLFFFVVHLYVIHLLAVPLALLRYGKAAFLLNPLPSMGGSASLYPADYGYQLGVVYILWIAAVVLIYPVCLWFARLKDRRRDWWLSYL